MQTETIKVAYVNLPKPGKKMGSIKDANGNYYSVWPDKLSNFEQGGTYTIAYTTDDKGFKSLKQIVDGAMPAMSANRPRTQASGDSKAEEMFVMAMCGKAVQGAGTMPDSNTLSDWVRDCLLGWRQGWARAQQPQSVKTVVPDDMNDEIPF